MVTVTVSPKYQVIIPREVRERLRLRPGQKVAVVEKDGVVHLIPIKSLKMLGGPARERGQLKDSYGAWTMSDEEEAEILSSRNRNWKKASNTIRGLKTKTKKSYFGAARGVGPFASKDEMKTHD